MTDFIALPDGAEASLTALWDLADLSRPWNPASEDIAALRAHPAADILVAMQGDSVIASVAVGHDGHRGWVYYVATHPDHRGQGLGRAAMAAAETCLHAHGAVKLMLMVREDNTPVLGFYETLGLKDDGVRVLSKWLSPERERLLAEHGS